MTRSLTSTTPKRSYPNQIEPMTIRFLKFLKAASTVSSYKRKQASNKLL